MFVYLILKISLFQSPIHLDKSSSQAISVISSISVPFPTVFKAYTFSIYI